MVAVAVVPVAAGPVAHGLRVSRLAAALRDGNLAWHMAQALNPPHATAKVGVRAREGLVDAPGSWAAGSYQRDYRVQQLRQVVGVQASGNCGLQLEFTPWLSLALEGTVRYQCERKTGLASCLESL